MAIWVEEAQKQRAQDQLWAIEAASVPYMEKESRDSTMRRLNLAARGITQKQADVEAEQRANRMQLLAMSRGRN